LKPVAGLERDPGSEAIFRGIDAAASLKPSNSASIASTSSCGSIFRGLIEASAGSPASATGAMTSSAASMPRPH